MTFCFAAQPEIEIRWYVEACHHNNVVDPLSDDDEIMFLCGPDIYQFNYLQHGNVKLMFPEEKRKRGLEIMLQIN